MKLWISILGLGILVVGSVAALAIHYLYDTSRELSNQIYDPLPIIDSDQMNTSRQEGQVVQSTVQSIENLVMHHQSFTLLVMGVDRRSGDQGRTDVLMVAAVNPVAKSTWMMNIPRDTRTAILGANVDDKINHAYAYGGAAMTIASVEHLLGIPVDYYIKVDMEGFQQIIDSIGGIEVNNTLDFQYEGYNFPLGDLDLQGKEALAYVRMRYDDPHGDIGRNERQRLVVKGIMNNLLHIQSVFKLNKIVEAIEQHVKTNLTFEEWKTMSADYREALERIETENLDGHGQIIDGIYYYIVSDEEKLRITEQLRLHLDE